jgi:hypothetical protein|tara:strand:+ start:107 stop:1210 length:1104 start_codon:yes stop_codon:yes gene_type:complete
MTDTLEADIPDSEEAIQENKSPEQRRQDLLQERLDKASGKTDEPEPEAPETEDEEDDEEEVEAPEVDEDEEEESDDESEDVPSDDGGFDIEDLDEDELEALTQQVASKAGKALTKARLQDKERKAEIEKLQEQVQELSANVVTSDNPFANIRSVESADDAIKQTEVNIKGWNRKLITDRVEEYNEKTGEDESGVMFGSQFMSVNQLLNAIDREEEKLEPLRSRKSEIKKVSETLGDTDGVIGEVRGKLGIEDDSDEAKEYETLLSNPKFELVKNILPEYAKELIEILGRAAVTKVPKTKTFSKKLKRKAPKSKTENVSLDTKAGRAPKRSNGTSVQVKKLQKIVSDPRQTIAARRDADQQIRILNRT